MTTKMSSCEFMYSWFGWAALKLAWKKTVSITVVTLPIQLNSEFICLAVIICVFVLSSCFFLQCSNILLLLSIQIFCQSRIYMVYILCICLSLFVLQAWFITIERQVAMKWSIFSEPMILCPSTLCLNPVGLGSATGISSFIRAISWIFLSAMDFCPSSCHCTPRMAITDIQVANCWGGWGEFISLGGDIRGVIPACGHTEY